MKKLWSKYPLVFLFAVTFACLAYVMACRELSPVNELKYISIADDALARGNWFTFYHNGGMYTDKPPFFFQLVMLLKLVFGVHSPFVLCLVSFLSSCAVVAIMDRAFAKGLPSIERLCLGAVFAGCGLVIGESVFLRMDLLMTLFIVCALASFYKAYLGDTYGWAFPLCTFLALYTKGPVGLLFPLVTVFVFLVLRRDYKALRRHFGFRTWGVLLLFTALWFAGVVREGGWEYLRSMVFGQIGDRVVHGVVHRQNFLYFFWVFPLCILPFTLLIVPAVARPVALLTSRRARVGELPASQLLMMCAVVVNFLVLSSSSSKLAIYITPLIPFSVYLIAFLPQEKWVENLYRATNILVVAICAAAVVFLALGSRVSLLEDYGWFYLCTRAYVVAAIGLILSVAALVVGFSKHGDKSCALVLDTLCLYVMILLSSPIVEDCNRALYH